MQKQIDQAVNIVRQTTGWHLAEKRREKLITAGFNVSEIQTKWNFGRVSEVQAAQDGSGFWIQIAYAVGRKVNNKGGSVIQVNACPCVFITVTP